MLLPLSVTAQQNDNFYVGDQNKPFTQKIKNLMIGQSLLDLEFH